MESLDTRELTHEGLDTEDPRNLKLARKRKREEQIQKESEEVDSQICVCLHLNILKHSQRVRPNWDLCFIVNCYKYCKMLKQLSRFMMPLGSKALFYNRSLPRCRIKEFLSKSVPVRIEEINSICNQFDKSPAHFNLILRASMCATAKFTLGLFRNLNMKQLKRLFSANKHTRSFKMFHCTLCLPASPDFSDCFRDTTLAQLELHYVEVVNREESDEQLHELDGLISGLSKSSDLHKSIKRIEILSLETFKEQNYQILEKYGFPFE
ncbi:unnamed protein product [Moneuplotes crassus]|uniref:Brix domain-containing protein n=1 Tax=Euplotes crassus TaxID=5936 RepID=A0AAD1U9T3_EUPCR|nr:unnamed protein product [Moneuplotes crassus]